MADIKKLLESIDKIAKEGTMASASKHKTGPKFGGYWKGTDPNPPKPGMGVGGTDESDEHFTYEEDKAYLGDPHIREEDELLDPPGYASRVAELENEGLTRSDAQGIADMEYQLKIGPWKKDKEITDAVGKQVDEDEPEECPACYGSGKEETDPEDVCFRCGGKGYLNDKEYCAQCGKSPCECSDVMTSENYGDRMMGGATFVEGEIDEDSWSDGTNQWSNANNNWSDGQDLWTGGGAISEDEEELYSGCYVRDEQNDGPNGEIFKMHGDPYERRVRIEDRNGRGWNISSSRLTLVDENDPAIDKWFGRDVADNEDIDEMMGEDEMIGEAKPTSLMARIKNVAPGDQVSKDKAGNFIFREEYYYRRGMDSLKFANRVKEALESVGLNVEIIDHGDHWAAFRGGANVKQSSHWWVKARVTDALPDVAVPIEETDIPDIERNRALAGAKVDDRADPERMAIWWSHYRRAIGNKQSDRQARDYADRMTASEPKFRPNPFVAKESIDLEESIEEIQESLKAAFEDYVKNKAEPEDKKERVTITYKDGHKQTKSVTEKEKKNYETSSHVAKVEPAKDSKGRLDDTTITENKNLEFRWTDYEYITNLNDRCTLVEAIVTESNHLFESNTEDTHKYFLDLESLSDTPTPNKKYITAVLGLANDRIIPLQPIEITEFLSFNGDFCSVKLTNGKITEYPFNIVRNRMTMKTFFFDSKTKFNKFQSAITLKFGVVHLVQRPDISKLDNSNLDETTYGGFPGSSGQAQHEIDWLKNKIEGLKPQLERKPSVARQIKDLERQIRERELAIAFKSESKLTEGISANEVSNAIAWRISNQKPELITKYGVEVVADVIDQVASFHAGAEELGTSDISIMVNQVIKDLERSYVKEDAEKSHTQPQWEKLPQHKRRELARRSEEEKWERHLRDTEREKQKPVKKDVDEAKFASRARNILLNKLKDMERMNKPIPPAKTQQPVEKKSLDEEEALMPHAVQLFQLMQPATRRDAFKYLDMLRKNFGPKKSLQTYRMAQKMRQANKEISKSKEVVEAAPQIDPTTGQPVQQNTTPGQQPAVNTATPITTPQTTAQQPPAPKGTPTAIPAPGQPRLPAAGQAGGAPVAPPPGTPKPETGGGVNTTTTPIQGLATSLQQLAQPGAQVAARKAADALARLK